MNHCWLSLDNSPPSHKMCSLSYPPRLLERACHTAVPNKCLSYEDGADSRKRNPSTMERDGGMAQWSRARADLSQDQSLVPSTLCVRQQMTSCNPRARESGALFWFLRVLHHTHTFLTMSLSISKAAIFYLQGIKSV